MTECKQLHVYVKRIEPRVLRIFFGASERVDDVNICEEALAANVREQLDKEEFEAAALSQGEGFVEEAGTIEITEDGYIKYDVKERPKAPAAV